MIRREVYQFYKVCRNGIGEEGSKTRIDRVFWKTYIIKYIPKY